MPTLLMLVLILGFPVMIAILNSFRLLTPDGSVWSLIHYQKIPADNRFIHSLFVTFVFIAGTVALHLLLGFIVALALNAEIKGRQFLRVLVIIPWTLPDVISGLIWRFMYNPTSGIINRVLFDLNLIETHVEWLGAANMTLPSVIFADVWRGYPFVMLVLLAGLQSIPGELYEAARVDGATIWQVFYHITLPHMKYIILLVISLDSIFQFRRFGLIFNMTAGGPGNATEILSLYIYKQYFRYFNFEYASALAIVFAVIMIVVSLPYVRTMVRRIDE